MARRIRLELTEAEAEAVHSALEYHLENPSDILEDDGDGEPLNKRLEATWRRALEKVRAAMQGGKS